jgi:two-component system sensor histidine kinase BaeS
VVGLILASLGGGLLYLLGTLLGLDVPGSPTIAAPAGVFALVLVVLAILALLRVFRTIARPLGALGQAAGRVEAGDYSVRVDEPDRGPGELRTLVSAFNEMAARLEAEDATRRRLLADVSHELRTPLAVIQGNLEALLDGVYPPDEAHLRPILDETKILERLVDDLRTLSLAESGVLPLHLEPTDPAALLEDVASAHRARAAESGVAISVAGAPAIGAIDADPMRLHQVLSNLVDNAVRAMPTGGSIALSAATQDGRAVFEVADDGPGIPDELRESLFERFTKSATSRGSGLGLAIARAIVEAHGGTIAVTQGLAGKGTRFRIELPNSNPATGVSGRPAVT